jgi:hypothetical protein
MSDDKKECPLNETIQEENQDLNDLNNIELEKKQYLDNLNNIIKTQLENQDNINNIIKQIGQVKTQKLIIMEQYLETCKNRLDSFFFKCCIISFILTIIMATLLYFIGFSGLNYFFTTCLLIIGYIYIYILYNSFRNRMNEDIQKTENQIELESTPITAIEERSENLFKQHQGELKKYYDQSLSHGKLIFVTGVGCIVLGFVIIIGALYYLFSGNLNMKVEEKIILAVASTLSGVLINYIAVIYLKMYSETIKSVTELHNTLATTHHLHFANFITSKIKDKEKREETFKTIALKIAEKKGFNEK